MPNVDAAYVSLLYEHLNSEGHAAERILGKHPPEGARISVERWKWMLERGAEVTGEAAFGLQVARHLDVHHFGVLGYLLLSCPSLMESINITQRYSALVADNNPATVRIDQDQIDFCIPQIHGWVSQASDEVGLGAMIRFMRIMTGQPLKATRVEFVGTEPVALEHYQEFFGCEVRFACEMPRLCFPLSYLQLPVPEASAERFSELDAQASRKLQAIAPLPGELRLLREQIVELIRRGRVKIEDLAALNDVTPRTLQRKLSVYSMTFQMLLDQTRRHLCEEYLADPRIELIEIAGLVGFSDQSTFTRAFTQWTGEPPGEWRRFHSKMD